MSTVPIIPRFIRVIRVPRFLPLSFLTRIRSWIIPMSEKETVFWNTTPIQISRSIWDSRFVWIQMSIRVLIFGSMFVSSAMFLIEFNFCSWTSTSFRFVRFYIFFICTAIFELSCRGSLWLYLFDCFPTFAFVYRWVNFKFKIILKFTFEWGWSWVWASAPASSIVWSTYASAGLTWK